MTDGIVGQALEFARSEAKLSRDELWALYWQLGGRAKRSALISYLKGETEPQVSQYNLIARVVNDRLRAAGKSLRLSVVAVGGDRCICCEERDEEGCLALPL